MTEADDRFLAVLADDLAMRLGPRATLRDLELERSADAAIRITATVESPTGRRTIEAVGDSLTIAASGLLDRAVEFRLADSFRELVEQPSA